MIIARVIGNIWATRKDEKLNGLKFMVVKPLKEDMSEENGSMVAADNAGAGIGEVVLITTGSSARLSLSKENVPTDAVIVGIVDTVELDQGK
jgi:ethanolamine utilization protein EutN